MVAPGADDLEDDFDFHPSWSEHEADNENENEKNSPSIAQESLPTKAKKRKRNREKLKANKKQKTLAALQSGPEGAEKSVSISVCPSSLQADYISKHQSKTFKDASSLELEELRFPESAFTDTTTYKKERTSDNLEDFISTVVPVLKTRLAQKPANKGAPTLLFIASAALRAADIVRALRPTRGVKGGEVAKLFAKHCKLEEQEGYLRSKAISTGVGTAGRIGKLLEKKGLLLTALTHIMVDVTHQDAKNRSIFDIPETRDSLLRDVLQNEDLRKRIESGKTTIVFF